jgi:predicted helicase
MSTISPHAITSHIQYYYRELDDLRRIAGANNESALRPAFATLLKSVGQEYQLIFHAEYPFKAPSGASLRADGVLLDRLRLVHGWWEAKDEKDDLDKELAAKLAKGYPSDNILFEDTRCGVLLQQGQEVFRCSLANADLLQTLLDRFFEYELPQVQNFRLARTKFLLELPQVAAALTELLATAHRQNEPFRQRAEEFLALCQRSIGKRVTARHVDEMLIQHILTDQIFRAIFPESNFHRENHLARAIGELENCFFLGETRRNLLKRLEPYFAAIRQAAANTITSAEKQDFLKQVYEDFYSAYNPKDADKFGVVYTPTEVVRFIIEGCDWLTQRHFNKRLSDQGLDILDPCMGTGTFIVDLLEYWRGDQQALKYKFMQEVHANEIAILPYYIAGLNIEQSFYEITNQWQEFKGACFVNTLENWGFEQTHAGAINDLFGSLTDENQLRIQTQNQRRIPVILGNPPYNANQQNENDNNKNEPAPWADRRIRETYLAESTAQKTKLYDPYVRFFRWASDRLGEQGVLAFISNRSYLDARQADGLRKTFAKEFQEIWIVDLMSDVRKNSKISGTKHNIFGIQTGVAVAFLVRNLPNQDCQIHYLSLNDFLPAIEKRRWLKANHLWQLARSGQFHLIRPNAQGDWLNQPTEDWSAWLPIASKDVKVGKSEQAIFKLHSLGISTNRDEWLYGVTFEEVAAKVRYFIEHYEKVKIQQDIDGGGIKWSHHLKCRFATGKHEEYSIDLIQNSLYRPYTVRLLYYSKLFIDAPGSADLIFSSGKKVENLVICFPLSKRGKIFSCLSSKYLLSLDIFLPDANNCLPLYQYSPDGTRHDNITDWALKQFREHYQKLGLTLTKTDIFNYVYAVLHDPRYRQKFALNLKQEFPRIPFHADFNKWVKIGKQLMQLHAYFEEVTPYPLTRVELKTLAQPKCRLKADKIENSIDLDTATRLTGIPPQAWQYQLGNRSALEWVLDQYKEKIPKDATIREKFNTYRFADHKDTVIELLKKVCRVSVDTMTLVEKIAKLTWE